MKKRIFLLATVVALLSVSVFGQNAKKLYSAGKEFVDNLKYEDAVVQFTTAIGLEPSNADYYTARANAFEMMKKYSEAYGDYEKALVFKSKDIDALLGLGRVCNKMKKYDEALALLNRAIGLDKRNPNLRPEKVLTLIGLEMYVEGLKVADTANLIKPNAMNYYYKGVCYVALNNDRLAKEEFEMAIRKEKGLVEPRLKLAELFIREANNEKALEQINTVLANDDKNTDAYIARSKIFKKNLDYPSAINDISKNILIDPTNPEYYLIRGTYYQEFSQHTNAINDFTKYISMKSDNPDVYFARARSYKEIGGEREIEKAIEDYTKISMLSEDDPKARKLLKQSKEELYKLNEEKVAPEINILSPVISGNNIMVRGNSNNVVISGKIKEKSGLDTLLINNQKVTFGEKKNGENAFEANIDITGLDRITLLARDEYNNEKVIDLKVVRTEINPPKISIIAPYTSEEGQVFLDNLNPSLFIEGKVFDESKIKSIYINNYTANFGKDPDNLEISAEFNPAFTATIDIANKNEITVTAEDIYGNKQATIFKLNKEGAGIASDNPMGKTWVVIIENSGYKYWPALDGAKKDVNTIRNALSNYQIHNIIQKKDMTRTDMQDYFNITLRNLLKENQVKSLLVWYAGHGKFLNGEGYWIPVDAERDNEYTYFNINGLKAGLQSYGSVGVIHTLVVSDACESGPGFYTAMRSAGDAPACSDAKVTGSKSAQVFSSTGYESGLEKAVDNSKFTATFANTLINNLKTGNSCIPIETIVKDVTAAVYTENGQKPKFGKIQGLEDMNGTFFFIRK